MTHHRKQLLATATALALLLTACSSEGENVSSDGAPAEDPVDAADADARPVDDAPDPDPDPLPGPQAAQAESEAFDFPQGFPVDAMPWPDGAGDFYSTDPVTPDSPDVSVTAERVEQTGEELVAFYEQALVANGWTITETTSATLFLMVFKLEGHGLTGQVNVWRNSGGISAFFHFAN